MLPNRFKTLALAGAAWVAVMSFVGVAAAADFAPAKTGAPSPTWSGLYIGGNIGYGWGSRSVGLSENTTDPALAAALAALVAGGSYPASLSPSAQGVIGGGQIGYNWQFPSHWLIGVETDLQGAGISGSASQTLTPAGFDTTTTSVAKKIDWFGTARARVGYLASPQWLLYATGGLAYGETHLGFNTVAIDPLGCGIPFGGPLCASGASSSVRAGWAAGAGVETMVTPNWSVKAEYLYVDLGNRSANISAYSFPTVAFNVSSDFREQIVRIGLNYHFN
jgi:outer membrane immunogenic protein